MMPPVPQPAQTEPLTPEEKEMQGTITTGKW